MRRREITLVALLAAVGGAAGGAILLLRDGTGKVETAERTAHAPDSTVPRDTTALETADPQLSVQRVVELDGSATGPAAELLDEPGDDLQDRGLDRSPVGPDRMRGQHVAPGCGQI